MIDFVERKLVISKDEHGDGWVGKRPKPKYHMASYYYAWDYTYHFNKKIIAKNKMINDALGLDIILPTLKINFCMSDQIESTNTLGTYSASNGCAVWNGIIVIDTYKIGNNWDQTKETIRHEICHAIHHQIYCEGHLGHTKQWIEIAKQHNVETERYERMVND